MTKRPHLFTFAGMDGVKGQLRGPMAGSVAAFMRAIDKYHIVSGAGDYGSVNLYRDDKGTLRGERHVRHFSADVAQFKTKKAARQWLTEQLPLCRELPTA